MLKQTLKSHATPYSVSSNLRKVDRADNRNLKGCLYMEAKNDNKLSALYYGNLLEMRVRKKEKLSTEEKLSPVEAADLVSYLVLEMSFYTKDQFKNFRSLHAYNQTVSGFITSILGQMFSDKYVVVGKLWIITTNDRTILSVHCHGCMVGLGECCLHIASILFYLEASTRLNEKLTCTQVKCSWILPTAVKNVDYLRVKDINFTSAKKMKLTLESTSVSAKAHKPKAPLNKPSAKELDAFYKLLSECKIKPVCLSLEKPYADTFISKTRNISTYADLFDPKFLQLNYIDLLKECYNVELSISPEDIALIERETVEQSKSNAFISTPYW
ncbi:Hypothetical predicted protein [Paramuricea clavata]|uniref:Uncharacterized protein n=1 Tax=Paramuricea clavata TaxID=317549 RepID=A0A6S7HQS1_PARCT|nr:Hypothetical predicted protein [Paramuricea clavata]